MGSAPRPLPSAVLLLPLAVLAGCGAPRPADLGPLAAPPPPLVPEETAPLPVRTTPIDLHRLSHADCLRLALARNRPFLIAHSTWDRARLGQTVALSQVYAPQLSANYTASNHQDSATLAVASSPSAPTTSTLGVSESVLGFEVQPFLNSAWYQAGDTATGRDSYTSSYGITVSHMLFNLAERVRQRLPLTTAETNDYIAANNVILAGKAVELATTTAFYNIQRALGHVRVREHRVEDARSFLALVEDNVAHGFKAPFETVTAALNLNQAQIDLVAERAGLQDTIEALARQLGLPVASPLGVQPEDLSGTGYRLPDLEQDLREVRAHQESLGIQVASIRLQLDMLRVQRDQIAPQISAGVSAQAYRTGHMPFAGDLQAGTAYSLILSWSDPLDFKAAARAQAHIIEDQINEATLALHDAEDDLERQLRSSWRHIEQLEATVRLSIQRVDAEHQNLAATLSRWRSGAIDNLEVVRSKQALDNAEIALLDARCDLAIAVATYRSILPAPLTDDGRHWEQTGPGAPAVPVAEPLPAP